MITEVHNEHHNTGRIGALTLERSRYGLAIVMGVFLLMVIPFYLRTYGGY